MASTYVLATTVRSRLGNRQTAALDRDGDGDEDEGLLDQLIAEAGTEINMRLAQKLGTPFANLPDTPEEVQLIALWIVLADCYGWIEPEGRDALDNRNKANAALDALAEGKADIPSQARAAAYAAGHVAVYTAEPPTFAGGDSSGIARTRGI